MYRGNSPDWDYSACVCLDKGNLYDSEATTASINLLCRIYMKTRKNKKKYTAGQIVQYDKKSEWHFNWKPLKVHNYDCGPNCFCLLGYSSWETSNKLALRTMTGINTNDIIRILDDAYGPTHDWVPISQENNYKQIKQYLQNKEATLAIVGNEEIAHYFVVFRDDSGLYAIDPQSEYTGDLWEYIWYIEERGFAKDSLNIVTSENTLTKDKDYNKVTMKLVKKYFPNERKLQRIDQEERRRMRQIYRSYGYESDDTISYGSSPENESPNSKSPNWQFSKSMKKSMKKSKKS